MKKEDNFNYINTLIHLSMCIKGKCVNISIFFTAGTFINPTTECV